MTIINDFPIHDHITPHYINLHLLKFPDIVKLHICLFLYDYIHDKKSSKFSFSFISEPHNYATHSTSTELHSELIAVNFVLLLLDGISGMTFLQIFQQNLTRNYLRKLFCNSTFNYFALLPSLIVLFRVYVCVFMFYYVYYIISPLKTNNM